MPVETQEAIIKTQPWNDSSFCGRACTFVSFLLFSSLLCRAVSLIDDRRRRHDRPFPLFCFFSLPPTPPPPSLCLSSNITGASEHLVSPSLDITVAFLPSFLPYLPRSLFFSRHLELLAALRALDGQQLHVEDQGGTARDLGALFSWVEERE